MGAFPEISFTVFTKTLTKHHKTLFGSFRNFKRKKERKCINMQLLPYQFINFLRFIKNSSTLSQIMTQDRDKSRFC